MIRKPTAAELGGFIRRHRLARGMTQGELGEQVGTNKHEIYTHESGRVVPSAARWLMICEVLDAPKFVQSDA